MKKPFNRAPRIFLRFFQWYCHPEIQDYIEGDLIEVYEERLKRLGERKADIRFAIDVILLFRPGIIRPIQGYKNLNKYGMYKSYFKIGWRNLIRHKGYSLINIGGLALGMAVAILIGLWIYDELTFNRYHENYDSIAEVYRNNNFNGVIETNTFTVAGLGTLLQSEYGTHFKHVVLVRGSMDNRVIANDGKQFTQQGYLMQSGGPELLSLKMIHGLRTGLAHKNSILLSASLAQKLFGGQDPINQVLSVDAKWDLKVTGVYEDLPQNSEFHRASYIAPLDLYFNGREGLNVWDNYNMNIYVQLQPGYDANTVSRIIKDIMFPHVDERTAESKPELFLVPMNDWHLNSYFENGVRTTSPKMHSVWYFAIIGGFVLLLACINFMNLSTARSEHRSKEVGIRKSIGSARFQLIYQFFIESLLVAILSFIVALLLIYITLPAFNAIADKNISVPWPNPLFWIFGIGFTIITGMLAGSYPALYLSAFNPIRVLKGPFKAGRFSTMPRKALVIVQFSVSIMLIVGTAIVYEQIQFGKNRPVGYTREGLISLRLGTPENRGDLEVLRNQLLKTGVVEDIAEANYEITSTLGWNDAFEWSDRKEDIIGLAFNTIFVTNGYGKTIGLDFISGRDFSRELISDVESVVINESAWKLLQVEDPIGEVLIWNRGSEQRKYTIIGIVKDMVKGSPFQPADPSMIFLSDRSLEWLYIRINPDASPHDALPKIQKAFTQLLPAVPFDYTFADEDYITKFKGEERISKLGSIFSVLAITISCLGLFGLSLFTAEQRTKEIGVRKILGASVIHLWGMLSREFVLLVAISSFIAIPIAYAFMSSWLQQYEYRTTIGWQVFVSASVIAMTVTLLTISYQAIRAALANPVTSLRSE